MTNRRRTWEKAFLSALEKTGIVAWAARAAGVGRRTAYEHRHADADFAERWEEALDTAEAKLEEELMRRALDGEQVPVHFKGKVVGYTTRKSDPLLMFAIRNLQRRRERDLPKAPSLRQFLTAGAPTARRGRAAEPSPEPAAAPNMSPVEQLPDPRTAGPAYRSGEPLPDASATALHHMHRGMSPETGGSDNRRRRGMQRFWQAWSAPLSALATTLQGRPLTACWPGGTGALFGGVRVQRIPPLQCGFVAIAA